MIFHFIQEESQEILSTENQIVYYLFFSFSVYDLGIFGYAVYVLELFEVLGISDQPDLFKVAGPDILKTGNLFTGADAGSDDRFPDIWIVCFLLGLFLKEYHVTSRIYEFVLPIQYLE